MEGIYNMHTINYRPITHTNKLVLQEYGESYARGSIEGMKRVRNRVDKIRLKNPEEANNLIQKFAFDVLNKMLK